MKERVMDTMQKFSKAMFIPVLILPIAGILIAIGNLFTNVRLLEVVPFLDNPITTGFGTILSGSLVSILVNLGLVFAVGLAVGLANKKKSEAGFIALLGYLVFINAMNGYMGIQGMLIEGSLQGTGQTMVLGVQILDMGVFLGIFLGIATAIVHNRFADTEFNNAFQIYGGTRFVFIVLIPVVVLLAILFTTVWPYFQAGIRSLGLVINQSGNFGLFLYGALERLLIPTGLHHLVYTPFLYSELGGIAEVGGEIFEGARNIYFAEIANPDGGLLAPSVIWDARGISKMFGLIGACLAMYHKAKPENKAKAKAILIPAAVTSFLAGVTEPIEFAFMFVAPLLFVVHAGLSGLSMVVLNLLNVRAIGPNGFMDFLLYNVPLGVDRTGWPMYIAVGLLFFAIYYFLFSFLIKVFNYKTIGREDAEGETRLYSKKDYKEKKAKGNESVDDLGLAHTIISALGGDKNIETVTNCYSRLRLTLLNPDIIDEGTLKNETGASGIMKKGNNVQVVYGLQVNKIRKAVDTVLNRKPVEE
ncbi:PTS system IIB component, Glc family (TC 4.A.1)/PTS system IIC component, Glc family (TC 4.A.1) [Alkalibacterium subtropicum]|uniref:PTS system IIB component, Glc family (TC 4.A.1)/PTS system IIC component, Glc family (TC 4.A.1) n=1 Tax=Alkalibacterium subtropicum TaxID=753702 RepID=A0A1I1HSH2_9LACT|nr:PTS transporter subunit EIIC [Alkalibacterium subtropicum]SFC27069.1 PTS system IIB component, Glc family (TC 4.A.1)/PTS system IIC component, Glc family (TC 4.A.1) [Alkalibacterium subtropicum]